MTDEELQLFFIQNRHKQICGRFKKAQIERIIIYLPANILVKPLSPFQKYLIVLLICFGNNLFSLDVVMGTKSALYAQTVQVDNQQSKNSTQKAKKKKSKKKKSANWETVKYKHFVLGLTQAIPLNKQPLISSFLNPSLQDKDLVTKDSLSEVNEEKQQKKKNIPQQKGQGMEFILPQGVLMRRRQSK